MRRDKVEHAIRMSAAHPAILVGILKEKGYSEVDVLGADELLADQLNKADGQVTYSQYLNIVRRAIELTKDDAIGLVNGQRLNATGHGSLSLGIMASDNLLHALEFGKLAASVLNPSIGCDLEDQSDVLVVAVKELISWDGLERFMVDTMFAMISSMLRHINSDVRQGIEYTVTYSDLSQPELYQKAFVGNVTFNAPRNAMIIPKSLVSMPSPMRNPIAAKQAAEVLEKERSTLHDFRAAILIPIQQMILENPGVIPSLEEVADRFHVSSRTLNRRLKDVDTSYKEIVMESRKKMALDYLKNSQYSIDQISHFLGYKDASNFSKAFRSWTGISPSSYRESRKEK